MLFGLLYCLFIGYKRGEKIWGNREDESDYEMPDLTMNFSKPKMIMMALIFAATVLLYITEWIPLAITSSAAALLCIITGCVTQKKAIASVNWNIVGRLAGCLGLAKALEAAGGTELISQGFRTVVGDKVSPFLLFCILVLLVQVTSEFISNSTAILVVLPIVLSIAPDMGLNTYSFASGVALSCPLASSTLGMSMVVGYRFNDYFKYSFFFDILSYITIIVSVPLIYGLTV